MITPQHIQRTHDFMQALKTVCDDRRLPLPDIREVFVTARLQRVYVFAVFPDRIGYKQEVYADDRFLHQISSALQGMPVTYSNSTGFRLVALLDGQPDQLPARLDYPEHLPGQVRLGLDAANREIRVAWLQLGHGLIVGMTGSGKSSELRAIVAAALRDDLQLILADLHDNTFPMLAGQPTLLAPIAHTVEEFIDRMQLIRDLITQRKSAYRALHARGLYPDDLDEYNAAVEPERRLKRVIALFDEFSSACDQDGARSGELAHLAFQNVTEARKFGINLIFSGQSFSADLVGPMRDQITTRLCFMVARKEISRIVIGRSGAEQLRQPGRALTERGWLQAYYFDKQNLIDLVSGHQKDTPQPITQSEQLTVPDQVRALATRCLIENAGRFSEPWLRAIGLSQREARRLQADWARHAWIDQDLTLGRAWVIAACVRAEVENSQNSAPMHGRTDLHAAHEPRTNPHEAPAPTHEARTEE